MTEFLPRIARPCPLRANERPAPGSECTRCARRVHDLDTMSVVERQAFLAGCQASVCVAYTRRVARSALGLGVLAAMSAGMAQASPVLQDAEALTIELEIVGGTGEDPSADLIDAQEEADYRALAGLPTLDDASTPSTSITDEVTAPSPIDPRSSTRKRD